MQGNAPCMHVDGEFCSRCYPPREKSHWGWSLHIDLSFCDPVVIRSKDKILKYVVELCDIIKMKRFGEPQIVHFGEGNKEGYSLVQLIETSCITAHFANDLNSAFIDIFSCKEFEVTLVNYFTTKFFGAQKIGYQLLNRG